MFECLNGEVDPTIAQVLKKCGYLVFQLSDSGIPDWSHYSAQNLFAVPEEHKEQFSAAR